MSNNTQAYLPNDRSNKKSYIFLKEPTVLLKAQCFCYKNKVLEKTK